MYKGSKQIVRVAASLSSKLDPERLARMDTDTDAVEKDKGTETT